MKKLYPLLLFILFTFGGTCVSIVKSQGTCDLSEFTREVVSDVDLTKWNFHGLGKAFKAGSGQFCIKECDSTFGVVLISPKAYTGDVVVRYKTMALTVPTVLVFLHSASDPGTGVELTIPEDYNGNMGFWIKDRESYFYAFRNAPHNYTPFIRKYPEPGSKALASAEENVMLPGVYYDIELGRIGEKLYLKIDGELILEAVDKDITPGGHLVFRIRGTAGLSAACLIKDLEVYSKEE